MDQPGSRDTHAQLDVARKVLDTLVLVQGALDESRGDDTLFTVHSSDDRVGEQGTGCGGTNDVSIKPVGALRSSSPGRLTVSHGEGGGTGTGLGLDDLYRETTTHARTTPTTTTHRSAHRRPTAPRGSTDQTSSSPRDSPSPPNWILLTRAL